MKRTIALFLAFSMLLGVTSCAKHGTEYTDDEPIVDATEAEDLLPSEEREEKRWRKSDDQLARDKKINEFYEKTADVLEDPTLEDGYFAYMSFYKVPIVGDMIVYRVQEEVIFSYNDGRNNDMSIHWYPEETENNIAVDFTLRFDIPDSVYEYAIFCEYEDRMSSSDLEGFIWSIDGSESFFYKSHENEGVEIDVEHDIRVLYARTITMLESTLGELGFTFEDFGFDFGGMYKDIDPTEAICDEIIPEFESHQFVDGICSECGKSWFDCALEAFEIYEESNVNYTGSKYSDELGGSTQYTCYYGDVNLRWWIFPCVGGEDNPNSELQLSIYESEGEYYVSFYFSFGGEFVPVDDMPNVVKTVGDVTIRGCMTVEQFNEFVLTHNLSDGNLDLYIEKDSEVIDEAPEEFWEGFDKYVGSAIKVFELDLNTMNLSLEDIGLKTSY